MSVLLFSDESRTGNLDPCGSYSCELLLRSTSGFAARETWACQPVFDFFALNRER